MKICFRTLTVMMSGDSDSPSTSIFSSASVLITHASTIILMLEHHAISLMSAIQLLCFSREHSYVQWTMKAVLTTTKLPVSCSAVSLKVVQVRQSNVSRFRCNGIRSNLFDRLGRVVKVSCIISSIYYQQIFFLQ
jgi:hypothetical protein